MAKLSFGKNTKEKLEGKRKNSFTTASKEIDYKTYILSKKEKARCITLCIAISFAAAILFYKNLYVSALFLPAIPWALKVYSKMLLNKRNEKLRNQFISGMSAYAAALRSGYSAENSIRQARLEIERIVGEDGMLAVEFKKIERRLSCHESIESAFENLATRTGIEEIEEMARIFAISKRSGGSLSEIVTNTVNVLKDKKRVGEEISTMMTAKKLEFRIMCLMPPGIILYVNVTSPQFISMMYEGLLGRLSMTVALAVYIFAIILGERIMRVKL